MNSNRPHTDSPEHGPPLHEISQDQTALEAEAESARPPMIYVASLSDYNAGVLHGTWIDATQDPEDIDSQIYDMLSRSQEPGAEEVAIHDYSGFGAWQPHEYESLEAVTGVAAAIEEHGQAVTHWIDYLGSEPTAAIESFEEAYRGNWPSMRDYAEQLANDIGVEVTVDPPSWLHYVRLDLDAVARDLEIEMLSGQADDGTVHIFEPSAADE